MKNRVLNGLEPEKVFYYFEELSKIPRGSGNEKAASDYLFDFGKKRNLFVMQDEFLNIIIKKPASIGYENSPSVIIQGHIDMVCEKNANIEHDFTKDGIKLLVDGDDVKADGTTLGADNGIAVAYALALLDDNTIEHPELEIVMTTDEEVGMTGAINMDVSELNGKYFINLDSEEEGELVVSCAGGLRGAIKIPIVHETMTNNNEYIIKEIFINNLKGGHSGMDIDKKRGNANKLTGKILCKLNDDLDIKLLDLYGGMKDNVIPREGFLSIVINKNDEKLFEKVLDDISAEISNEYKHTDGNISVYSVSFEFSNEIEYISKETTENIIFLLMNLPNGVIDMSPVLENIVESSLNLGKVSIENSEIEFLFAIRSSIKSVKFHISKQLELFAKKCGGSYTTCNEYPEWEYNQDSNLLSTCVNVYAKIYGDKPIVKAIHAGLEPGVFIEKLPHLDAISFGPNVYDVHSPDERFSITSTQRTWEYLKEVLKSLK